MQSSIGNIIDWIFNLKSLWCCWYWSLFPVLVDFVTDVCCLDPFDTKKSLPTVDVVIRMMSIVVGSKVCYLLDAKSVPAVFYGATATN